MKEQLSELSDRKVINIIKQSGYKQKHIAECIDYNHTGLCDYMSRGYLTPGLREKLEKFINDRNLF